MFAYGETVTFLAPGTTEDEYGNHVETWDDPATALVKPHAAVEPRPSGEANVEDRNAVTSGFTLYWSGDVFDVDPTWRAVVRGETWNVLGDSAGWVSPFTGWRAGTVVQVGRTDG
jgi:head-tail adaptor